MSTAIDTNRKYQTPKFQKKETPSQAETQGPTKLAVVPFRIKSKGLSSQEQNFEFIAPSVKGRKWNESIEDVDVRARKVTTQEDCDGDFAAGSKETDKRIKDSAIFEKSNIHPGLQSHRIAENKQSIDLNGPSHVQEKSNQPVFDEVYIKNLLTEEDRESEPTTRQRGNSDSRMFILQQARGRNETEKRLHQTRRSEDLERSPIQDLSDNEGDRTEDNFVQPLNFYENTYGRDRSDTQRSNPLELSRNASQVIEISDYSKITVDGSPEFRSLTKLSRFGRTEHDEAGSPRQNQVGSDILNESILKLRKLPSEISQAESSTSPRKSWRRVSLVVKSIIYMRNERVRSIGTAEEMYGEMEEYKMFKIKNIKLEGTKKDLANDNFFQEALDLIRRTELLCDCATIGSDKHLKMMAKIIENDPRRHMVDRHDATHVLNKHNKFGQNALYLASKFGNLNVIKFLLEQQADPHLRSNVGGTDKVKEKCLHVAARWGNADAVAFLVKKVEFSAQDLKLAIRQSEREDVKKILVQAYRDRYGGLGCWFRLLYT